jgi:hypothetical protein
VASSVASTACATLGLVLVLAAPPATACDICALHSSTVLDPPRRGWSLAVTEQFTSFNTYKKTGGRSLPVNEWIQSSTTNVILGYGFRAPLRLEVMVPIINREFRRLKDQRIDRDDVSGLGDVTIITRYTAIDRILNDASLVRIEAFAGLELPTGDTDQLDDSDTTPTATAAVGALPNMPPPRHGGHTGPTGVHDQDLALGSGSVDAIFGLNAFTTYRRLFATTGFQYKVSGHGDHGYRYDNELAFHLGIGGYLLVHHLVDLGLETRLTGETKGNDRQRGETVTGSNLTALYLGPMLHATFDGRLRTGLGVQLPVLQHVSELQLVRDYRILASLGWYF